MQTKGRLAVTGLALLLALAGSGAASAQDAQQLARDLFAAYSARDYDKAIEINQKLVELQPDDPTHPYNMACLYSLKDDKAKAGEWLTKAIDLGFSDFGQLAGDADLNNIHDTEAYKSAHKKLLEKAAQASTPVIVVPDGLPEDKPAPVIVALHPYGATPHWIIGKWKSVAARAGAVLVAPRALRPVPQRGGYSWGTAEETNLLVQHALMAVDENPHVDKDRSKLVLTGYSQGATMALALAARHAERVAGVIAVAGEYEPGLAGALRDARPRFYLMTGSEDRVLDSNKTAEKELNQAGAKTQLVIYDGLGHEFPKEHEQELDKAIKFVLGD